MDLCQSEQFKIYNSIKELLLNIEPFIRAVGHSDKTIDEVLKHLREYNEHSSCESFKLKRIIMHQIRFHLDETIMTEARLLTINSMGLSPDEFQKIRDECIERISETDAYTNIWYFMKRSVERSMQMLVGNFDAELDPVLIMKDENQFRLHSYQRSSTSLSDPDSLELSATNFCDFSLMKSECFQNLVNNLNSLKPLEIRIKTLQLLCNVPSTELLTECQLGELLSGLKDALVSSNKTLFQLSLQFHSKMMCSSSSHVVKEMYINIIAFLKNEFLLKKSIESLPNSDSGIDLHNIHHQKILLIFRLLDKCHKRLIKHWVRYPESHVRTLIHKAVELLSLKPKMKLTFTPLHYFALLDAEAGWLHQWLRRSFSRSILVSSLNKHKDWLFLVTKKCLQSLQKENRKPKDRSNCKQDEIYTSEMMDHISHFNIIKIIHALLKYSQTRKLFFSFQKPCTIDQILLTFVDSFLFCKCVDENKCDRYCISNGIAETLIDLVNNESSCSALMLNESLIQKLCTPLSDFIKNGLHNFDRTIVKFVIAVLKAYNKNHLSKNFLQAHDIHEMITEFAILYFGTPSIHNGHREMILKFRIINLCCILNSNLRITPSCKKIDAFLELLKSMWLSDESQHETARNSEVSLEKLEKDSSSLPSDDYLKYLQSFALTALGSFKLQKLNILEDCLFHLANDIIETSTGQWNWKESIASILYQSSFFMEGILAIESSGLIKYLIQDLWIMCESNLMFTCPVFTTYLMDSNEQLILGVVNSLLSLIGSFAAVTALMNASASIPNLPSQPPRSIKDFFSLTVFRDTASTLKELTNAEHLSLAALYILSGIVSNLNSSLFLQAQYGYQDVLIQSQIDNQCKENGVIIRDALSEERNYILVKTLIVGGPTEKRLPVQVWETEVGKELLPLFASCTPPREYQKLQLPPPAPNENNRALETLLEITINKANASEWNNNCCSFFEESLTEKQSAMESVLLQLLEKWFSFLCQESDINKLNLSTEMEIPKHYLSGIELTFNYGLELGLLTKKYRLKAEFKNLLSYCIVHLFPRDPQQDAQVLGFPWLVASVFLMMQGDCERSKIFLSKIYRVSDCKEFFCLDCVTLSESASWPILIHCVELMLSLENTAVWSVFKSNSFSLGHIIKLWIQQCFWNYLDWNEIIKFIFLSLFYGPFAIISYLVSVFKHLEKDILQQAQIGQLTIFFLETPLHKYHLSNYINFITDLMQRYHSQLLALFNEKAHQ